MRLIQLLKTPEHLIEQTTGGNTVALTCRHCIDELGEQQAIGFNTETEGHSVESAVTRLRELVRTGRKYEPRANCRHTRGIKI